MEQSKQHPGVGWHYDIAEQDYHSWKMCSASRLRTFDECPAQLAYEDQHGGHDTDAMLFGRAYHCAVLQPDLFPVAYVAAPEGDRRTKEGKLAYANCVIENPGKAILSASQYQTVLEMSKVVRSHPTAGLLIESADRFEATAIWEHDAGCTVKQRCDILNYEIGAIIDLKTTRSVSPREYWREILKYKYHRQGALYLDGAEKLGTHFSDFVHIAQEGEPPYHVVCYRFTPQYLTVGREELKPLFEFYAECERENSWPGYNEELQNVLPPSWLAKKYRVEIEDQSDMPGVTYDEF